MWTQNKLNRKQSLALAFAIPVISIMMIQLIGGYEPFGDRSMLYSDCYHQYYPFWVEFRETLRSGDSILYSWAVGLGLDFLSLISYYLASPLNLIALIVPESWTLEVFSLLVPVKLGLASLFFAIFLNRMFDKEDLSIAIFGGFYGLCAWALGYQWNVMWLDTFALLPLLALGTVQLLRDKKFILYTVSLFLSVYANYYIGLFVCIFVLLLFFVYQFCRWQGWKRFLADFVRIGCFTVIGIGMTTVITLPALAGLMNTQSSVNKFPEGFRLNIASENTILGLLDAMGQVAGNTLGLVKPTFKEGLPNLYCGVSSLILASLFCTSKEIKLRDKICSVGLLLFFMVSFIIRQLDYIWHGFHFTNMIPYRFSFLFSFVVLYMAYRAWLLRDKFCPWQMVSTVFFIMLLILFCESGQDPLCLIFNLGFLALYLVVFFLGSKPPKSTEEDDTDADTAPRSNKQWMSAGLLAVMALELVLNVVNFGVQFPYTAVSNYPKGTTDTEAVIEYMESLEADTLFYRAETTHTQTLNDGALNGYHGITTFTSSANVRTTLFMKALGYGAKNTYNRYSYEESSPVANLFLGIKYMIERDGAVEENSYFDTVYSSGNVYLLENNAYLPLGFLTNQELADMDWDYTNAFTQQNVLFTSATGIRRDVWNPVSNFQITGNGLTIDSTSDNTCYYSRGTSGSTISYNFVAERNGFMCIHLDVTDKNSYKVYLNGQQLYSESMSLPQMIAVSDVQAGDQVTVELTVKNGEDGHTTVTAGILDGSLFREGYEILRASTLELTEFSNTVVQGSIDCDRDGLLYTSIPYDGNWVVYVDGEETQCTLVGDCMMAVYLSQGSHTIRFEYHNAAFDLGWKISLSCLAVLILCTVVRRGKNHGRKYLRKK